MLKQEKRTKKQRDKKQGNPLYDLFSSVKLTVALCLVMAVISLTGTLIKQDASPEESFHLYGSLLTSLFQKMGLFDLYHSAGFTILLFLLAANLVCCSVRNLPRVWKLSYGPRAVPTSKSLKARENHDRIASPLPPSEAEEVAARVMEEEFGVARCLPAEEGNSLFRRRGAFSRFGPYLTHLGILLILAGAMLGSLLGFKGYVNIPEGDEASSVRLMGSMEEHPLDFSVQCREFAVEFYENGMPREYRSELVVREGTREVMTGSVRVNHPLTYRGITFYQSSYGQAGPAELTLTVRKENQEGEAIPIRARMGEDTEVPGTGDRIRVMDYAQDFVMPGNREGMQMKGLGPAVQVMVFREDKHTKPYWVLQNFPEIQMGKEQPYALELKQAVPKYYTGLQVARDPGTPIVWAGCTLLIFGLIVAFYFSQREIWMLVVPATRGSEVVVAGWANKNKERFAKAFQKVAAALRRELAETP